MQKETLLLTTAIETTRSFNDWTWCQQPQSHMNPLYMLLMLAVATMAPAISMQSEGFKPLNCCQVDLLMDLRSMVTMLSGL